MLQRWAIWLGIGGLALVFGWADGTGQGADARTLGQLPPAGLPPCTGGVAFPAEVRLREPAPDLPAETTALLGIWEGSTAEGANPSAGVASTIAIGTAIRLAVEEVTPGRARIVYGQGDLGGSPGSWTAGTASLTPGRLQWGTTSPISFTLSNDRQTLSGTVDRASGRIGVRLTRCTMGETVVPRPTVRPTNTPVPSRTPTPTLAPLPAPGGVMYQDDFTDSGSGWARQTSDPALRVIGYQDGEYQVLRPARGPGWTSQSRSRQAFDDVRVEVDARLVAPTEGAYVFLGFRYQSDGGHYALEVEPDAGVFRLLRHVTSGSSTVLVGRTRSAAIRPGNATNRLGLWGRGDEIALLINEEQVGRARDDRWADGGITLGVGHRADGSAEGRFANLVVTRAE